jgi:aromatic-L-amino-acid decarboxylase
MVPASLNEKYVIRFCVCAQHATDTDIDHAFDVISQFATDLFEIIQMDNKARKGVAEEQKENAEDEAVDEVFMLDRKRKMSLRYKRSFFVRMVSDPKLYNPKIVRALSSSGNRRHTSDSTENDSNIIKYNTPV